MSLEALIIFSLLNAGQLAENSKVDIHKEQKDAYVYVKKRKINNFILYIRKKRVSQKVFKMTLWRYLFVIHVLLLMKFVLWGG